MRGKVAERAAPQEHLPARRPPFSGKDIEQRTLARTVRADEAAQVPLAQRQRYVIERSETAETHGNISGNKRGVGGIIHLVS
jgi:hypothetical protein